MFEVNWCVTNLYSWWLYTCNSLPKPILWPEYRICWIGAEWVRWIPISETRTLCQSHSNPTERRQRWFDKGKVIFTYTGRRISSRANRKNSKYPLRLNMILIIYIHVYRQYALYAVYVCVCRCIIYTKSPHKSI